MASSPPTSKVEELCMYIFHANPEEPAQCSVRRQVPGEAGTAEEAADDWLEEVESLVIEFLDPELDAGTTKRKPSGRLPMLMSIGNSREMAPSALLPISSRGEPSCPPHSGTKKRLISGSSGCGLPKFKIIRRGPSTCKELPTLSPQDVNAGLQPPTEPFATDLTPANTSAPNTPASHFLCSSPSYHPSPCPPISRAMPWRPQTESPNSSGHCNVRVTVLAPETKERQASGCKVVGNSVFVKRQFWFRLQIESSDLANTEVRVSTQYKHKEAGQTPPVSCDKDYIAHKSECPVCASRMSGDRPFMCSNNAMFPVHFSAQVGAAREVEAPFTPLDPFVCSADPNKVTLQMTAICLTSCEHHKKRQVMLLVEARHRDDTTFRHVDTYEFAIRCSQSPTRDSKQKCPKSIRSTPSNMSSMSPASSFFPSPPSYPPGLCPNSPPSACLSHEMLEDNPMLSAAASPPFSPSDEIHQGEFDVAAPLQASFKNEPYDALLGTNRQYQQLGPGTNKPIFYLQPSGLTVKYSFEVPAGDLATLKRIREFLHRNNIETSPGYKVHES